MNKKILSGVSKGFTSYESKDTVDAILTRAVEDAEVGKIEWFKTVAAEKWEAMSPRPKLFKGIANSTHLDRHKEVVLPRGANFQDFLLNPVLMDKHDHRLPNLGNSIALGVSDNYIVDLFYFHGMTERSREELKLYEEEQQRAFSIGFVPCCEGVYYPDSRAEEEVKLKLRSGKTFTIDLKSYSEMPWAVHYDWVLLEKSCVVVGSNPAALYLGEVKDIATMIRTKSLEALPEEVRERVTGVFDKDLEDLETLINAFEKKYLEGTIDTGIKAAIAKHSTPVTVSTDWSKNKAKASVAKYASEGGTGKKEDMDFIKYAEAFAWFNTDKVAELSSYLFIHHYVEEGLLVTSEKALHFLMHDILKMAGEDPDGDNSKIIIDIRDIYEHAAGHLKDGQLAVPEFKTDYTEEELKAIKKGDFEVEEVEDADATIVPNEDAVNLSGEAAMEALNKVLAGQAVITAELSKLFTLNKEQFEEFGIDVGSIACSMDVLQGDVRTLKQVKIIEEVDDDAGSEDQTTIDLEGTDAMKCIEGLKEFGIEFPVNDNKP